MSRSSESHGTYQTVDEYNAADLAARLAKAERALEEAEKVSAPLAEYAAKYDTPEYDQFDWAAIAVGHLRAARKWMESRPSPPKEGE